MSVTVTKASEASGGGWALRFKDHAGRPRTLRVRGERRHADATAQHLERLLACRRDGLTLPGPTLAWLQRLPAKRLERLGAWDLLDPASISVASGIDTHVAGFVKHLKATGASDNRVATVERRLRAVIGQAGIERLSDLRREKLAPALSSLRVAAGLDKATRKPKYKPASALTIRGHAQACNQFAAYLIDVRQLMTVNPVHGLGKVKGDARARKRVLTHAEQVELLGYLACAPSMSWGGSEPLTLTGDERYLLTRVAIETGFRFSTLAGLLVSDFDLDSAGGAKVYARAEIMKNRQPLRLTLAPGLAERLRKAFATKAPSALALSMPERTEATTMLLRDVAAARAAWVARAKHDPAEHKRRASSWFLKPIDFRGWRLSFHSLRGTRAVNLLLSGVPAASVAHLIGHGSFATTSKFYADYGVDGDALSVSIPLPDFDSLMAPPITLASTGTDGAYSHPSNVPQKLSPTISHTTLVQQCRDESPLVANSRGRADQDKGLRRKGLSAVVAGCRDVSENTPGWIRTTDLIFRKDVLYPTELPGH